MAALYAALPKFAQTLDEVKRQLALSQDSDEGLELMPMLLLGLPGIGAVGGNPRWLFQAELGEDVLDQLARMPPRDMRCSLMTACWAWTCPIAAHSASAWVLWREPSPLKIAPQGGIRPPHLQDKGAANMSPCKPH